MNALVVLPLAALVGRLAFIAALAWFEEES